MDIYAEVLNNKKILVTMSQSFYGGESDFFRIRRNDGFSKLLPILEKEINEESKTINYILENDYFDLDHDYFISDQHNMTTRLLIGKYVRSDEFNERYAYDGKDLGSTYSKEETTFKVWAPIASSVFLHLGEEMFKMEKKENGVWEKTISGDCDGKTYTYLVDNQGVIKEAVDPYSYSSTPNGEKSVVIDLSKCDIPLYPIPLNPVNNYVDQSIYELHIRDFSVHPNSGIKNKGKFLAFTEKDTKNEQGNSTGLSYLKSLGFTHLQLMPFYDFGSVDEVNQFDYYNWGYDPVQYSIPEGSYASNVFDPYSRIIDCKKMIASIHEEGLRVIMDVVYNHMFGIDVSAFNSIVPSYFFRLNEKGELSNGSFCGNDFDSMMKMGRKYIIDSVERWVSFYGVDGFRFDLMGVLDYNTMNQVFDSCKKINPNIMVYGEGWNMPTSLPVSLKAAQLNNEKMPNIAHFNDRFRDIIKGATQYEDIANKGYGTGSISNIDEAMDVIIGTSKEVDYDYHYQSPNQVVNYVECHDNNTLWDKMLLSNKGESFEIRKKRVKLMNAIIILSQGIPFIHAGQEFLRTKKGDHNSYISSDEINAFDYDLRDKHQDVVDYTRALFQLRKENSCFRLSTEEDIEKKISIKHDIDGVIYYDLFDFLVLFNPFKEKKVVIKDEYELLHLPSFECISLGKEVLIEGYSATILKKK